MALRVIDPPPLQPQTPIRSAIDEGPGGDRRPDRRRLIGRGQDADLPVDRSSARRGREAPACRGCRSWRRYSPAGPASGARDSRCRPSCPGRSVRPVRRRRRQGGDIFWPGRSRAAGCASRRPGRRRRSASLKNSIRFRASAPTLARSSLLAASGRTDSPFGSRTSSVTGGSSSVEYEWKAQRAEGEMSNRWTPPCPAGPTSSGFPFPSVRTR